MLSLKSFIKSGKIDEKYELLSFTLADFMVNEILGYKLAIIVVQSTIWVDVKIRLNDNKFAGTVHQFLH